MGRERFRVAVVGATGAVGKELVSIIGERGLPVSDLLAFATERSYGEYLECSGREILVRDLKPGDLDGFDLVFLAAGGDFSRKVVSSFSDSGPIFIDNSSVFRMEEDVPLVVPEINAGALKIFRKRRLVANPNCSTTLLCVVLHPLHMRFRLKRVVASTYQSVSGAGTAAMEELTSQVRELFQRGGTAPGVLPHQIAFNLIPFIGRLHADGYCEEERKIIQETRKILEIPELSITATTVRVPLYHCHSESVHVTFEKRATPEGVREALEEAPGVTLLDDRGRGDFPMPFFTSGKDDVHVGRIREDPFTPSSFNLWLVGDNLRKGAALNAVQIAETLIRDYL